MSDNEVSTVIDNTELALDVPEKKEESASTEPVAPKEKKIVKQVVEIQSDDTCGACTDLEGMLKEDLIPKAQIPTEISKQEASEERKKEGVPFSRVCHIYDDGSKECGKDILGGDKEEWSKELNVSEKKEESQDSSSSSDLEASESKE